MSNNQDAAATATENATATSDADRAAAAAANLAKNEITVRALKGEALEEGEFAQVRNRLVGKEGNCLLKEGSHETALSIVSGANNSPEVKASTQAVLDAHDVAIVKVVSNSKAALITVLSNPIGAPSGADEAPEVTAAKKELGSIGYRLTDRKALPGLARKEQDRGQVITGLSYDAYKAIKDDPAMADLIEVAATRKEASKARIAELETTFKEKYPEAQVKLFRTLETIQDYQNDPKTVTPAERAALVVRVGEGKDAKELPIFEKGKLTQAAKDKLNDLQKVEGTPEFIGKMIRGVFAKDTKNKEVKDLKKDIGL